MEDVRIRPPAYPPKKMAREYIRHLYVNMQNCARIGSRNACR